MSNDAPIGVFDSGVGGVSVLHDIRARMPHENLIYVADSAHVPYGSKTQEYIQARSLAISRFLVEQQVKAIVVACNTATAAAVAMLRQTLDLPVLGMEPAVKPAVAASRSRVIGVLATVGTLKSAKFAALLDRFGQDVEVLTQPCPGLPEQVESGELDSPRTYAMLREYCAPLLAHKVDTIVLGCTHYPFLRPVITEIVGPDVALIDTGAAVARHLSDVLEARKGLTSSSAAGSEAWYTSSSPEILAPVITRLWGKKAEVLRLPQTE